MKYKDGNTWKEVTIKALDSMPIGTIVEYDGQASDIPSGWQSVTGGKIKKISETTPTMASIVDDYSTSTQDGYSANYVNAIRNLMKFSDWTNLYSSGNNYVKYRYNAFMCEVFVFLESTHVNDFTAGTLPSACRPSNRADQELTGTGLNYGRVETSGNVILHNENGYATGTFTYTLTN